MKRIALFLVLMLTILLSFVPLPAQAAPQGPLFKITMIAPGTANLVRRQWALITANSFQAVGIDARVVFLSWGAVYDRVLTPARENLGKTFDEGGWDALFIGWTPGLLPLGGIFQIHYSKNWAPTGSNYYLWSNPESDKAIEDFMAAGYTPQGEEAFKRWQRIAYEEVPKSVIVYQAAPIAASPDIDFNGYEWIYDNIGCVPQFLKTTRKSVVFGTTGEIVALNPPLSNSWYDSVVFTPIVESLFVVDANKNFKPALAESYEVSADGRTFTYRLRRNVKWHDGVEFTADDVLFSIWAYINPATGTQNAGYYAGFIGEDITFKWENGTEARLVFNPDTGEGWYPAPANVTRDRKARVEAVDRYTVKITLADFGTLGKPTAIFHPEGDGFAIIPKHVLENVPLEEWSTHPFNTGTGTYVSNGQTFSGPMGTGPYRWVEYDSVKGVVHLKKFADYWNRTALESQGMFGVEDYYVRFIIEKDAAIAALKNDEVQILDQNYQLQRDVTAGTFEGWAKVYRLEGTGIQELGYNTQHPVWGTGVETPLGKSDPSKAALAAKYVRQAFDYLIPRQLIIDSLLGGFGSPGITHASPTQPYFDTTLSPRPYNPEMAKSLLAAAGYETGVAPPTTATVVTNVMLGMPVELSGRFVVDPKVAMEEGGFIVLLQSSTDNQTWTNVAQSVTTTGGYYTISYQPKAKGTYYFRVYFPGTGAKTASLSGATGPDFPYAGIPRVAEEQYSPTIIVTVTTIDDTIKPLQDEISSLKSQLAGATSAAYGLGIIAIILGAIGVFLSLRKKS
jgi:ABC-type transport system substrate-binding protein